MGQVVEKALPNRKFAGDKGFSTSNDTFGLEKIRGRKQANRPYKLTLAQQARNMSYYKPVPKKRKCFQNDRSLFLFGADNKIRLLAKRIIDWPYPF